MNSAANDPKQPDSVNSTLNLDQPGARPPRVKSLSLAEMIEVERRIKAGLEVNEEERRQHAEAQALIQKAWQGARTAFTEMAKQVAPVLVKLPDIGRQIVEWQTALSKQLAPVVAQMAEAFQNMPPRIKSALVALGKSGWYLDGELGLSELWTLKATLDAGETEAVDVFLTEHYEERLSAIEAEIIAALPKRARILSSAFSAHRRGEFELSVPVLLAQADGICLDLTGLYLFIRANGAPQVAQRARDATLDAVSAAILSPLTEKLPIYASHADRDRYVQEQGLSTWIALNRHLVLHGESLDYGTKVNSLKAISLINYLVGFASP